MYKNIERNFKVWGYTASHNFLMLRSPMLFPDLEGYNENTSYNIDIEFSSVAYMEVPAFFNGIEISELKGNMPAKLEHYKQTWNYRIFEIKSGQTIYYVVAGNCLVGKNGWENMDRIYRIELNHDEILFRFP